MLEPIELKMPPEVPEEVRKTWSKSKQRRWERKKNRYNIFGRFIRARLEETSFCALLLPMMRAGYSFLEPKSWPYQVMGADSPKAETVGRPRVIFRSGPIGAGADILPAEKVCGWQEHADKKRDGKILGHWHCTAHGCTKLHKDRASAESCPKVKQELRHEREERDKQRRKDEKRREFTRIHNYHDTTGKKVSPDAVRLMDYIDELAQDWYSVSWMQDMEYMIWRYAVGDCNTTYGYDNMGDGKGWPAPDEAAEVFRLAMKAGGWWIEKGMGYAAEFIALERWEPMYRAWLETHQPEKGM
jgi:hypothetical protein